MQQSQPRESHFPARTWGFLARVRNTIIPIPNRPRNNQPYQEYNVARTGKTGAVRKRAAKAPRKPVRKRKPAAKRGRKPVKAGKARKPAKPVPAKPEPPRFDVRALDPRRCGPDTSVQLLYRIEETSQERAPKTAPSRMHLVFFDRHGWYCEHGRDCPAVPHAQREARKSGDGARTHGPTHNGRMRA